MKRAGSELMARVDGRRHDEIRPVEITPGFVDYPEGSVLLSMGNTRVLCNVTVEAGVPRWMGGKGQTIGWVTAEYALLPRATHQRTQRETAGLGGRTQEIRRLIGRSLRAGVNLAELGPRTCIVDCDVLQADGGTRTAAITGGYVALAIGLRRLISQGSLSERVFRPPVAAISVGRVEGLALLDLCYAEDVAADVDVNVVMNADGRYVELQGTAEGAPFSRTHLDEMLDLAYKGIGLLLTAQRDVLDGLGAA